MSRLEIKQSDSGLYCQILEIWELVVSCEKNEIHVLFLDSFNDLHSCLKLCVMFVFRLHSWHVGNLLKCPAILGREFKVTEFPDSVCWKIYDLWALCPRESLASISYVCNHTSGVNKTTEAFAQDAAFFGGWKKTAASSVWRMMVQQPFAL